MGGGYYDRAFAFTLAGDHAGPLILGIAWDCQQVEQLSRQAWDVPLDAVLTESGLQVFNPRKFEHCRDQWQSNTG